MVKSKEQGQGGVLTWCNEKVLPNCRSAIALAERGAERELNAMERLALKYHSQLCLFCACNALPFEIKLKQMREAERTRKTGETTPAAEE
mgnify:CR=1 FL=1